MELTINKPPALAVPPALPPYLTKRRGGKPKWVVIPDITMAEQVTRLPCTEHNWYTLIYRWMMKINLETGEAYRTITATRIYRQWLETYETEDGIPPHICFGGAITSGERDETFYSRWQKYAQEIFA